MTVLVTGGTRGIGFALCRRLIREGRSVAMVYRSDDDNAKQAEASLGERAVAIRADLTDAKEIARVYDGAEDLGPVESVVHSAVEPLLTTGLEATVEQLDRCYRLGPRAFVLLAQQAARRMAKGGDIVAVTSPGADAVAPYYAAIGMAKAALNQAVRIMALELAPRGIRVNAVSTATLDGHHLADRSRGDEARRAITAKTPAGRMGSEQDAADTIALLLSDDARWIYGQVVVADGGLTLGGGLR